MNVTPDFAKRIISQVAGEDVLPLVEKLKKQDNLSEFILAQQVEYEINVVRNMLYRLYHANLVSFTRKKDKQKGWYIYYWTFRPNMISEAALRLEKQRLEGLRSRLAREQGKEFYRCPDTCMRMEFIQAMEYDFKCPECGKIMNHEDNSESVDRIRKNIAEIEDKIEQNMKLRESTIQEQRKLNEDAVKEAAKEIAKSIEIVDTPVVKATKKVSSKKTVAKVAVKVASKKNVAAKKAVKKPATAKKKPAKKK